ncbi:hypothetical protein EJ03DRAFT_121715 [Teratosphaeria nubilosa]|uniref:DUF6590 domain-containing protein n=1 Tax=Teratosphaeria nubilosa TaxID=161662 RepID=A0A6G1L7X4_9PEZI|nr:hypothetical protein EJ03DRAFT_121715 [Teratosphaeria nubilosa]
MLLAPPPSRASALTTITALQGYVGGTRKRRFVIIQESRNDGRFSALPIITGFHNGAPRGVAKPGLIRENYSVIYTGRIAPNPTPEEAPRPLSGGGAEPGMLPNPIRVDTYAPTDALDPMSRLNYGSPHTFDRNINIRWFGRVHPDSMQHLIYQHRLVASRDAASGQQDARNTAARTISRQDPGSSNTAARRESRQDPGPNSSASPQSDAISEQELDAWLAQINATARQNNRAAVQLTPQQRAGVLASAQVRARFYQTLLQNWSRRRE